MYAKARIAIYWIVNLIDRQVEVYTAPRAGRLPSYRKRQDYRIAARAPFVLAGQAVAQIPVADLILSSGSSS